MIMKLTIEEPRMNPLNERHRHMTRRYLLGRTADGSGQQWWLDRMNNGATRNTIASTIQRSPEAWTRLVENVFDEFLHRDANSTELVTWINLLASGSRTERDLAIALMTSDEYGS